MLLRNPNWTMIDYRRNDTSLTIEFRRFDVNFRNISREKPDNNIDSRWNVGKIALKFEGKHYHYQLRVILFSIELEGCIPSHEKRGVERRSKNSWSESTMAGACCFRRYPIGKEWAWYVPAPMWLLRWLAEVMWNRSLSGAWLTLFFRTGDGNTTIEFAIGTRNMYQRYSSHHLSSPEIYSSI